jgi:hypothetical protein
MFSVSHQHGGYLLVCPLLCRLWAEGGFAPRFREMLYLDATQTALLVAVPVLLGSSAPIPMGMLADSYGGRSIFTVLMLITPPGDTDPRRLPGTPV